ncbi:hypothetical protein ISG21_37660, partial [Burkholderia pseudomallei]|nr:hypothetical protein [Burkholderia pseudomallei]
PAAIGTTARRAIAADAIDARATGQMGRTGAAGEATEAAGALERPASFAQQRFWVLARTQDAGAAYHVSFHW